MRSMGELYTVTIYSEHAVGLLHQIAIIFARRRLNIETLQVSASEMEGLHKFKITLYAEQEAIEKTVKQIEKRVDILKASWVVGGSQVAE